MTQQELTTARIDLGLIKSEDTARYYRFYDTDNLKSLLQKITIYDLPITKTETIYVECKKISQSKLRETGFSITRNKDKATFIVIDNFLEFNNNICWSTGKSVRYFDRANSENFIDNRIIDLDKDYAYVTVENIYKHIYKYEGNVELYTNIKELLKSGGESNVTMAMEFMSNANWENNKVYLMDIFNDYRERIYYNPYRTSISFKGFSESLGFNFRAVNLKDADNYRPYCSSEEHHQFVFKKFEEKFKNSLADLIKQYKIQVDEFKYSIDYNTEVEDTEC
jgi:hypothetical protein